MPPAFFKRHAMHPDCLMEQPVPISYYNNTTSIFQPATIRQLLNLKTDNFIQNNQNVSATEVEKYQMDIKQELFNKSTKSNIIERELAMPNMKTTEIETDIVYGASDKNIIMGVEVPQSIDDEVNEMTDDELNDAFDKITADAKPTQDEIDEQRQLDELKAQFESTAAYKSKKAEETKPRYVAKVSNRPTLAESSDEEEETKQY